MAFPPNTTMLNAPRRLRLSLLAFLFGLALALPPAVRVLASGTVALAAAPDVIYADGKSATLITATVRDSNGHLAPDGTTVRFTTTLGLLTPDTATTTSGVARVSLTSTAQAGTASLTAVAFAARADGAAAGTGSVEFTEDRQSLFDKDARWIRVDCPQYLIYSADTRMVEAQGKRGSAHLSYRALDVTADAMQIDLQTQTLVARRATVQRGRHVLRVAELRYDLVTGSGTAILAADGGAQGSSDVIVTGYGLDTSSQPDQMVASPLTYNPYRFQDLSASHVVVGARAITAAPGDQIQFRRATIYSDGKKLLSVPYHVMPMSTDQIFGQQIVGVGSQGLFLNVPYYYNMTPHSRGTVYLRNSAYGGANLGSPLTTGSSFFSQGGRHGGMALDLEQSYDAGRGGSGQFQVNGITRSEWGAQFTHNQRVDEATNAYVFVDYPEHRSLYASSNVSHQFGGFSLNVTASGTRDPGEAGYSASSYSFNTYLQTNPRILGHTGLSYAADIGTSKGSLTENAPGIAQVVTPISTTTADLRLSTQPFRPDKRTMITDSVTVGEAFSGIGGRTAPTVSANLGLIRTFRRSDTLSLNYTYRYDPLLAQVGAYSSDLNPLEALLRSSTQQRLSASYTTMPLPRLSVSFSGGYGLPLNDRSFFATARYRITPDWGVGLTESYEKYVLDSYRDVEYLVSRRVFGHDLVFYYSARDKKLRFDFAGSSF